MRISDEEFDAAVAEALDGVPERFKAVLDNIAITVADEPTPRERATMDDPHGELLGLYQGVPLTRRTTGYSGVMPDIITIFKGPHERVCGSRVRLVEQIRRTVLHEIGHYFGFDDEYLHAHGY
ncbi:metallopeptidase family protein [Bifidobacterium phasiani]|uniref:Metallopeptidase family protein n=1 Tax=Bifidobacterium phasiani TaxID=2834431 RepID=A0ABS6W9F6_9BIFI|nr:metallopeptidase family protein [Bifidobacterium phasiani]MBW3082724.1 metallopeptidase family protein [Bifidobacterium phasiani]